MTETTPAPPRARRTMISGLGITAWARKWTVLCTLVVLVLASWQGARYFNGVSVPTDRVARGDLIETVVVSGHVETPFRVDIGSQITGTVKSVLVNEGQRVTKGQELIALEAGELQAAVAQAQGVAAQAEARIRQLEELTLPSARATLSEAKATWLNAQQSFDRAAELSRTGAGTKVALDAARKDLDIARTQVRTAELQVFTASPGGSDYVMAQTQLNQAGASLDTANARLGYASIAAPRDGVLITRSVEQGSVVQAGKVLLVLAPAGDTQLVLQIDERNLSKLALGQKAVASADAYADKRMNAVVSYINPAVDITRASVQVKLTVADPPDYLRQDMTVSVDIEVARSNATLVLPVRAVRDALSPKPWVLAIRNRRATRLPVRLGLQGTTQFEILDGIAEGEYVIPAIAGVADGDRVRPSTP